MFIVKIIRNKDAPCGQNKVSE